MSINIPPLVQSAMNYYGIPWPDVNEDAFLEIKVPLRQFGSDLQEVGEAVEVALAELETTSQSLALSSIRSYVATVCRNYLERVEDVCVDLAGAPCDATYHAIVTLKIGMITALGAEVVEDALDVLSAVATIGTDSAAALAAAEVTAQGVKELADLAVGEISASLLSLAEKRIDDFVSSVVQPFLAQVTTGLEGDLNAYIPHLLGLAVSELEGGVGDIGGAIRWSDAALAKAVAEIASSAFRLEGAAKRLSFAVEAIFSVPDPSSLSIPTASSALRSALKHVVTTVERDLEGAARELVQHVIAHVTHLLEDFRTALMEMDAEAANRARAQAVPVGPASGVVPVALGTVVAGVTVVSGYVDSGDAGAVSAGEAAVVEFAGGTTGRVDAAPVDAVQVGAAEEGGFEARATGQISAPTVAVGQATSEPPTDGVIVDTHGPDVGATSAEPAAGRVEGVRARHDDVEGHVAAGEARPEAVAGLEAQHEERHRPTARRAEDAAQDVHEMSGHREGPARLAVDASRVSADGEEVQRLTVPEE